MNNLLLLLRKSHNFHKDQVAAQLDLSIPEYDLIEHGQTKLNLKQAERLAELYNIESSHLLADNAPVVNYNIGTYSRGITNVQNYFEGSEDTSSEV